MLHAADRDHSGIRGRAKSLSTLVKLICITADLRSKHCYSTAFLRCNESRILLYRKSCNFSRLLTMKPASVKKQLFFSSQKYDRVLGHKYTHKI